MNKLAVAVCCVSALAAALVASPDCWASAPEKADAPQKKAESKTTVARISAGAADASADSAAKTDKKIKPGRKPFAKLLGEAQPVAGLIQLYRKDAKLYGEIAKRHLNKDFIVIISIARGIGRRPILGGMSWGFGDDWIWQFRKADDRIQIVRRNVRFRAAKGSPQEEAVRLAYTDSVLFSLPIVTTSPGGAPVVDLTPVFKSDLPQISSVLRGFSFSRDKSSWAAVKGFKDNVEIQVAATYTSSGTKVFETVADSRGVTIHVHYSISLLPQTGYKPRVADDRVGYFLTVLKDYSKQADYERFVRYVNRWDLRKAEPAAKVSPPKKPVIFWIEKTVPFKYRKPIREGIEQWNKAFEQAGFVNAIEVRQQPADARWDPEDINYNTFRWMTAGASFAMGPSRVNPLTGQILDADIIFDADFLQRWKEDYNVVTPEKIAQLTGGALDVRSYREQLDRLPPRLRRHYGSSCNCAQFMARQLAFGATVMAEGGKPIPKATLEKLIAQGLKMVVMHEVGHTLGLRHNFKASAFLTLDELNDPAKTGKTGLAASVMDYLPINLAPKGKKQGDFFSTTIGPYDYWAIQYGYQRVGSPAELKKIAARCAEPALDYGSDGDARGIDPDPLCNRYDLGKDPIRFARQRVELVRQAMPDLVERTTEEGEGYHKVRRAFNILLGEQGSAMRIAARFIGGLYVHRDHKGDPKARPPVVVVDEKKQREALALLEKHVFGREAYQFPPDLYGYLAPTFWSHWGVEPLPRHDYPVHEAILSWQDRTLLQLLSPTTLARLIDSELKVPADREAFTAAELLGRLTTAVFSELEPLRKNGGKHTNRKPAISSLRRSLQRRYLDRLSRLALGESFAPEDCQSLATAELRELQSRVDGVLAAKTQLDPYTRAHLQETSALIRKVLDAALQLPRP